MNNTVYNIFAVIGMLNCTVILVVLLVMLYCWIGDMWFYYFGRVNIMNSNLLKIQTRDGTIVRRVTQYEPMEHPITVDLSIHGSLPNPSAEAIANGFHGGRYR